LILPAHIAARVRDAIAAGGLGKYIDEEARGHDAIALMGTIGAIWMLRADGTLWNADADFGIPLTPLAEEFHTRAIVAGVERFPWLAELLPVRPSDAVDCASCEGRGHFVVQDSRVLCPHCEALGWRLPDAR
jgi:hypothetical protein